MNRKISEKQLKDSAANEAQRRCYFGREATKITVRAAKDITPEWENEKAYRVTITTRWGHKERWLVTVDTETGDASSAGKE